MGKQLLYFNIIFAMLGLALGFEPSQAAFKAYERGKVVCGIDMDIFPKEFGEKKENFRNFAKDICRAYAVALFQDDKKFELQELSSQNKMRALKNKDVDMILLSNLTHFEDEDAYIQLMETKPIYFDYDLIALHRDLEIKNFQELQKKAICMMDRKPLLNHMRLIEEREKVKFNIVTYKDLNFLREDFLQRKCQVFAGNYFSYLHISLYDTPGNEGVKRADLKVVKPYLQLDPLGIVVLQGDDKFFDFAEWIIMGLIEAEEKDISKSNILSIRYSEDPSIQRLLGNTKGIGVVLNISDRWLSNVVLKVGNYKEIYERNLGAESSLKLERGYNHLWTKDGLLYAIPVR